MWNEFFGLSKKKRTAPAGSSPLVGSSRNRSLGLLIKALAILTRWFSVKDGEIFGFLGPNGSGKSTTQKILTGILKGYGGTVDLFGEDVRNVHKKKFFPSPAGARSTISQT